MLANGIIQPFALKLGIGKLGKALLDNAFRNLLGVIAIANSYRRSTKL
ncbi:hypothetical protein FEV09_10105 [Pseudanabaena catenata USMAC16]|uniref:Uncharacterized protein n=1 Tax=Pseudanabaena catenata USMAC16 TaxID=1855837 RepID=A0A9X4RLF7_9CYAN|nr:hypothetical protein [Pseudanabaena catenata]MDG3494909.1 hypothetical protein [Pseudanabaena catenata USMAC16]